MLKKEALELYAVTDRSVLDLSRYPSLYDAVASALKGGAACIQLREKDMAYGDCLKEAETIHKLTSAYQIPLIINDNVELAKACNAEGVHLGQDDMDIKHARMILGSDKIIGVSAHNVEEALAAERAGADYLGCGSVFVTTTKQDVKALSLAELHKICEKVSIPVVAIGGISKQNMEQLTGTGISGVAVVSAIFGSSDIEKAAKKLKQQIQNMLKNTRWLNDLYHRLKPAFAGKTGALFDMDGTLIDSMPLWRNLDIQYMAGYGIVPDQDFHHTVAAMTLSQAAAYIKEYYKLPKTVSEICQDFHEMVYLEYRDHIPLKPLAYEFVKMLKWKGYRLAVATANEIELSELVLKRTGLDHIVDAVVSCSMAGASKEQPDVFFYACDKIGIAPEQCVIFEDSIRAIETAKNAGFATVGVYDEVTKDVWETICGLTDGQVVFQTG